MHSINTLEEQLLQGGIDLSSSKGADEYMPLLSIIEIMLGVRPKIAELAKVWDTAGFPAFFLIFKNSIDMPTSMLGTNPFIRELFLAMFAASREVSCDYCMAHTVSVSIRRGVLPNRISRASGNQTPGDAALLAFAKALASYQDDNNTENNTGDDDDDDAANDAANDDQQGFHHGSSGSGGITKEHIKEMRKYFSCAQIYWVALAVAMVGYLNFIGDAFGLQTEEQCLKEAKAVLGPTGWKPSRRSSNRQVSPSRDDGDNDDGDSIMSEQQGQQSHQKEGTETTSSYELPQKDTIAAHLRMMKYGPSLMTLETLWVAGMHCQWPQAGRDLKNLVGYKFPVLGRIKHKMAILSYSTVIRNHFDVRTTKVGLVIKALASLIYAHVVKNDHLIKETTELFEVLATKDRLSVDDSVALLEAAVSLSSKPTPKTPKECSNEIHQLASLPGMITGEHSGGSVSTFKNAAVLILARAASDRPTTISSVVVNEVASHLSPAARVEVVMWLGLQVSFHRLNNFWEARKGYLSEQKEERSNCSSVNGSTTEKNHLVVIEGISDKQTLDDDHGDNSSHHDHHPIRRRHHSVVGIASRGKKRLKSFCLRVLGGQGKKDGGRKVDQDTSTHFIDNGTVHSIGTSSDNVRLSASSL